MYITVIDGGQSHSFRFVRSWREEITWIILPVCVVAATLLLLEHSVTCAYAVHHRFPFHFSLAPLPLCPAAVASGVQSFAFPSPPVPLVSRGYPPYTVSRSADYG